MVWADFCTEIPDETEIIRFRKFDRFKKIIKDQSIYFCRIDLFPDKLEGTIPESVKEEYQKVGSLPKMKDLFDKEKKRSYANCWYLNTGQKDINQMWDEGFEVGIVSTKLSLINSLNHWSYLLPDVFRPKGHFECALPIFEISYIDHKNSKMSDLPNYNINQIFSPFHHKAKKFSFENELRPMIYLDPSSFPDEKILIRGYSIKLDLKKLIKSVIISPTLNPSRVAEILNFFKRPQY